MISKKNSASETHVDDNTFNYTPLPSHLLMQPNENDKIFQRAILYVANKYKTSDINNLGFNKII